MQATDITEAMPYLVHVLAKTLVARKSSKYIKYEGFDKEFNIVLKSNINTVFSNASQHIPYADWYDLKHSLEGACTHKLKQAVLDEMRLMKLDNIT